MKEWDRLERWARVLRPALPERLISAEQAQGIQQIYELLLDLQQRDQQPALQAIIELMEQRYVRSASTSPASSGFPQWNFFAMALFNT